MMGRMTRQVMEARGYQVELSGVRIRVGGLFTTATRYVPRSVLTYAMPDSRGNLEDSDFVAVDYAGSRMHVLDWTGGADYFLKTINEMIAGTGAYVGQSEHWMPRGEDEPAEFKISDRAHASWLLPDYPDVAATMPDRWLGGRRGNVPNWDLACQATFAGEDGERRGIILVEAKAHEGELGSVGKSCADPESSDSQANHERIGIAIGQAAEALGERISRESLGDQFSNRIATSWRLATSQLSDPKRTRCSRYPASSYTWVSRVMKGMGDRYLVDGGRLEAST